jgi:peroxiredoxin
MERGGPAWVGVWALASLLLASSGLRGDAATPDELLTAIGLERAKEVVQAPEFTLADLAGRPVSAQAFRGNVVLLTFWASHCDVCLELLPSVERLHQRFKDRGFAAVAISIDVQGAKAVRPEVEKRGWSFPVLLDPQFETIRKFGTRVIPASYLIDQQGTIISSFLAPRDWDSEEDFELIEFLLTHPPAP